MPWPACSRKRLPLTINHYLNNPSDATSQKKLLFSQLAFKLFYDFVLFFHARPQAFHFGSKYCIDGTPGFLFFFKLFPLRRLHSRVVQLAEFSFYCRDKTIKNHLGSRRHVGKFLRTSDNGFHGFLQNRANEKLGYSVVFHHALEHYVVYWVGYKHNILFYFFSQNHKILITNHYVGRINCNVQHATTPAVSVLNLF